MEAFVAIAPREIDMYMLRVFPNLTEMPPYVPPKCP